MKHRISAKRALLGCAVVLLVAGIARVTGCADGALSAVYQAAAGFDRAYLEAIVAEVRRRPFPAGQEATFRLADPSDPRTLRAADGEELRRGGGAGLVWARRTAEGKLQVTIETRDLGHAGEYGFAYSELTLGLTQLPGDGSWQQTDVPGRLTILGKRIDERWVEVLYNLD